MARNGSGTYSKVNTFVAGSTITASGHNQNWDDLVSEMTNSVAADGQTTMTGPLKASSGSVSAPGVAFASDLDTGIYRIGSNEIGVAVGGAKALDISSTGLDVTGTVKQNGLILLPVGLGPLPWSGSSAPSGWVLTGQTLLRASYPDLWTFAQAEIALGNTLYTNGNGSTTFTIASIGGRVLAGKESSATNLTSSWFGGDSTVLGATGGNEKNALSATNQLPQFTPSFVTTPVVPVPLQGDSAHSGSNTSNALQGNNGTSATQVNVNPSNLTLNTIGSASPSSFRTCQPTIICNYIIFAGV